MFRKPLFGRNITPACTYCTHSRLAPDQKMYYCTKFGVVAPYYKCHKFNYDPLRRVPKRQPKLPHFSPDEFKIT